jgi:hypothetical protein
VVRCLSNFFGTTIHTPESQELMQGATDYESEDDLKNPVNQVVAILPGDADVQGIVAALYQIGFSSDIIGVLSGRKDAHKLDAALGKQGWFAKLTHIGPDFGDLDAGHLKEYAEALGTGDTVIAVSAKSGDRRREIAELLKSHEAKLINSYGLFSIEGLG